MIRLENRQSWFWIDSNVKNWWQNKMPKETSHFLQSFSIDGCCPVYLFGTNSPWLSTRQFAVVKIYPPLRYTFQCLKTEHWRCSNCAGHHDKDGLTYGLSISNLHMQFRLLWSCKVIGLRSQTLRMKYSTIHATWRRVSSQTQFRRPQLAVSRLEFRTRNTAQKPICCF